MKLDLFIESNMEAILVEWEAFAKSLSPITGKMTKLALRDHARQILLTIALDIETAQNPAQQMAKAKGMAPDTEAGQSAASVHGALRQASDFSLLELSAEFRALRACVLRLWLPQVGEMTISTADEMVRFNEAIDQALAESVVTYTARADHMRELFLAILGHDLRAPLSSMSMAGELLTSGRMDATQLLDIGKRVKRGSRLMSTMVEDLIGFTRTQLGAGMPTVLHEADLKDIFQAAIDDARAAHPETTFELVTEGSLTGQFDAVRMHQLMTNLLVNAAQYGTADQPVRITARSTPTQVMIEVANCGPVIPPESLEAIFSPLIQLPGVEEDARPRTSLGLGLFVAREIALAHGGGISATSSEQDGTVFSVSLARARMA
ncbi:MAG: HAMP domain-containing histidine kinase [Bdellovibrionales bacterium]|nr:HAMP domain-containing histidine kinase [Massilia sp.]